MKKSWGGSVVLADFRSFCERRRSKGAFSVLVPHLQRLLPLSLDCSAVAMSAAMLEFSRTWKDNFDRHEHLFGLGEHVSEHSTCTCHLPTQQSPALAPPAPETLSIAPTQQWKVHTFLDAGDLGRLSQTSKHMLSLCFDEVSELLYPTSSAC